MRVFSCILASIALLSACQPQSVTTADGTVITVMASVPETIDTDTTLELTFSDPIPASADLRNYISVSPFIDGSFAIATDGLSATFAPTPGWEPGVSYTVSVEDDAAFGNDTLAASSWTLQSPGWTEPAEQFSTGGTATGWNIATDSMGNVYVLVSVTGSEFDGLTLEYDNQVFIQKFKPSGEKLWTKTLDVDGPTRKGTVHITSSNDIIVGFTAELPADDAEGPLTSRGMVMALDSEGNAVSGYPWSLQPTDATKYLGVSDMRVSESGDVYLLGQTHGSIDGNQTGNGYLAKFNSNESLAWIKQFGGSTLGMSIIQMSLDADGNAFLVLNGDGDFEGTTHTWSCNRACNSGAVMKITAQGNIAWVKRFGQDNLNIYAAATTVNAQGEVWGAFEYYFTADQTSSTLNEAALSWKNGMAMVRFDTNGNHLSTQPHGNIYDGGNWPYEMLLTNDDTIIGTGVYAGTTWEYEGWLAEWDSQGVLINERAFPGSTAEGLELWALAMDPWGNTFATGVQYYGADNNYESSLVIKKLNFD